MNFEIILQALYLFILAFVFSAIEVENEGKYFAWAKMLNNNTEPVFDKLALEISTFQNSDPFDFNEDDYPLIKEHLKPY